MEDKTVKEADKEFGVLAEAYLILERLEDHQTATKVFGTMCLHYPNRTIDRFNI